MTNEDSRSAYRELAEVLRSNGLAWVLGQVEETIEAGRHIDRKAEVFSGSPDGDDSPLAFERTASQRRRRSIDMVASEPFSDRERLLFLIDGIRQALIEAARVENEQIRLLREFADIEAVSFQPDTATAPGERPHFRGITGDSLGTLAGVLEFLEMAVRA